MKTKEESNRHKVTKGISSQTFVTLALGILEIVSFSIMSRLLTKEDFGYYSAISAIVIIFASFADTGIGAAIIQRKELTKRFTDNAFTLSLIFGSFISLLLLLLSYPLAIAVAEDATMTVPLMLMSVTLLFNCMISVFTSIMQRRLEFLKIGAVNLSSLIVTASVAITLAYLGYGYYAIITRAILQAIITFFVSLYYCKTKFNLAFDKKTSLSIFKFSGWLMASVVFRNLSHQVDRLLMPRLINITDLGAYSRPKAFINQISTKLNGIFDIVLFPVLSSIQDEKEKLKSSFRQSLYILNVFAMLLALSFAINSELIIRVFFGDKWLDLVSVTVVLSFVLVFNIDGRLSDCFLRSMAMTKQQFYFRVFEAIFKTLGVLVSYRWGIIGVAASVVVTNTIVKLIKIIYIAHKVDVSPWETIVLIVSSWKFSIYLIPVCVLAYRLLPHSITGNIILAIIFALLVSIMFFFVPSMVGKTYKDVEYKRAKNMIRKKFW